MTDTIANIKLQLKNMSPNDEQLLIWQQDKRVGVQNALRAWQKKQVMVQEKREHFLSRFDIERQYWMQGYDLVAGVDEVGRGPLAGPVVAAAVILPHDFDVLDVIDSKQLSAKKRDELYDKIIEKAISIGVGSVEASIIDEINIYEAARVAMTEAVNQLAPVPEALLIDAMRLDLDLPQEFLIKGDARSNSIGAASIIAKVTRDRLMASYGLKYHGYGFEKNAGYGTKEHLEGIKKIGITPIHRKTFAPIKDIL
ncbi:MULTISPECIES: ribonuclease HII [Leuconostoc]|uniref:Ribonuclease HII n=1 Tax=Leuconostoc suionicum TaxID=1511761 RepID=A0A2N9K8Z5_9LACO|nr:MULTISPECIES: ribonuclease HII [Leuconostoc]MCT4402627.1 ribonuclease HII [Leuconostoc suionicum]MDI6497000.1 ribonuclease HII [Leuconostoc suionicum]MDI6499127.1 ribonuclease HII [Leuconostoc suionicum]MDI6501387.1 ribonuclease HII [Leuconostoc suionicum]MDI6522586.1 ribonuclease HII [Leuconostoc suionicum]